MRMRWRLLAAFLGLILLLTLAQDLPLVGYLRNIETERLLATLERNAFVLAGNSENLLSGDGDSIRLDDLQATVDLYAANEGARVIVTDRDGRLVVSSDDTDVAGDDFANRPEIGDALSGRPVSGQRLSKTAGGDLVYVAVPVLSGADTVGVVRLTFPADVIDERTNERVRGLVMVGAISMIAAVLAALLMSNSITSPLRRLQRSTEALAAGDFEHRAATDDGAPELRSLGVAFNTMTERIAALLEQQKSFAGDASHQLRTPLTALRLQLERAAEMVGTDPEGARDRIEAASQETERLQRLVEGLLLIARSTGSNAPIQRADVTAIARERAEVWQPLADERGITMTIDVEDGLEADAVANGVEQIIDNYVDNAINVSQSGDTITISARRADDGVEVHVIDEGPGLPDEQLARAFDRFWRSPDAPHGGSGIGLAVVQHLATLGGGHARLRNRTDRQGLDASVTLRA